MKLISMTDFVFMLRNRTTSELCNDFPKSFQMPVWNGSKDDMIKDMLAIDAIQWKLTGEYAKFLKQPLTLGMFVPCLPNGEPFTDFQMDCLSTDDPYPELRAAYEKAKENVLFKGFEIKQSPYDPTRQTFYIGWEPYNAAIFIKLKDEDWKIDDFKTIEDLLQAGYDIELTESAIKHFM